MPEKGKVSIIVPLYKVEKYIHRCIDSITEQTYEDLEIILVNDGSPDNCGEIAEEYRKKDSRIKVIHKENGGLSDARNYGMRPVTGEYTMFIDSDDWIERDMVACLLENCLKFNADVVQGAFYYAHDDQLLFDDRIYKENKDFAIFNKKEAMRELVMNEKVKNFAWGKLYKTELIRDIPFKKGVLFEDVFWAHQVIDRVEKFILISRPFYYYYQREDSIVATYTLRNLDMIKGLKERHRFLESFYPKLREESLRLILKMCLIHYQLLWLNRKKDPKKVHRKELQSYLRQNYRELKNAVSDDSVLSWQLNLFSLHPFFQLGFLGVRKGLRSMKIISTPKGLHKVEQNAEKESSVK
ncbi:glycosyltransferase family 2 protein [Virgibacillus oceani]